MQFGMVLLIVPSIMRSMILIFFLTSNYGYLKYSVIRCSILVFGFGDLA